MPPSDRQGVMFFVLALCHTQERQRTEGVHRVMALLMAQGGMVTVPNDLFVLARLQM